MNSLELDISLPLSSYDMNLVYRQRHRGVTAVIGTSGSGKSTFLKAIAGFYKSGNIRLQVNGELWQSPEKGQILLPHRRKSAYLFQETQLLKFMSPYDNLIYGYKRLKKKDRRIHPQELIQKFGLETFINSRCESLSGGERQKLALARSLLTNPQIWLMDEPLSAIDHSERYRILSFLQQVLGTARGPCYYVSHEPDEVSLIAQSILVLDKGRILFQGSKKQAQLAGFL